LASRSAELFKLAIISALSRETLWLCGVLFIYIFILLLLTLRFDYVDMEDVLGEMTAASNLLQTELSFWNIFNCSPVEIYMRLRSLDGWVKSVHSRGSNPGQKTVLTLSLMYAARGEKPKEFVFFFAISLGFLVPPILSI